MNAIRYIEVTTCEHCHHRDHKGAFAPVSYVPVCRLSGGELPHEIQLAGKCVKASLKPGIPDTCPLPKLLKE